MDFPLDLMVSLRSVRHFFSLRLWEIPADRLPARKRLPLEALKLAVLTAKGYAQDRLDLRATALTLNSLLAIVPVLALLFGIAQGFGLERHFQAWILSQFPEQQQVLGQSLVFARRALETAKGGLIAGAGVIFLLYAVVTVVGQVEQAVNHIWSINRPRGLGRKFSDYLSLILVGPFLLLGASSLNIYVTAWLNRAAAATPLAPLLGPAASLAIRATPYLLLWLLFSFTYIFLPNTKVRFASGLVGGLVAALLYQASQNLYIQLQVGVSRNNAIYGSFAALPLFIIWLRISWNIVLLGAELTQQHQNFGGAGTGLPDAELSFREIKRVGLDLCASALDRFEAGRAPAKGPELAEDLGIPARAAAIVLERLVHAGLLIETVSAGQEKDPGYLPARPRERLTPTAIVEALERQGEEITSAEGRSGIGETILVRREDRARDEGWAVGFERPSGRDRGG